MSRALHWNWSVLCISFPFFFPPFITRESGITNGAIRIFTKSRQEKGKRKDDIKTGERTVCLRGWDFVVPCVGRHGGKGAFRTGYASARCRRGRGSSVL
ncbi:hypothetical protein GGS23DRAFT_93936 [Durotheca rogersii]|uniref:uncharacterized protein n=1 Tax=Durotheca rogersii TaxID=419775 RepID=UPI00221FDEBD|nr:uncharacterized protein GGS23DRAFT_93936 [Durotheca rogersii]KAI5862339.1 hypothetical protein GGS23DRAFT_93936 [Durotheca rogersii]